ncbi:MAG: hypothetical protein HY741_18615 [Chloroflexi bacterium]|nr:hypothetical protein [Chloroflexota bacterium]
MARNINPVEYKSFVLRIWRDKRADAAEWRAVLANPLTGERIGFGSLDALVEYLLQFGTETSKTKEKEGT